jgi:chromosome segregation ATPase
MELHKAFKSIPGAEVVKELIANATKIVKELEVLKESPEGYISDYFEKIKTQVNSRRETLKDEIDLCSDRMIDRIEKTRSECIQMNVQMKGHDESLEVLVGELNRIKDQFNSFKIKVYFNKGILKKMNKIKSELDDLQSELNEKLQKLKDEILQNNKFYFEYDELCVERIFGDLRKNGGKYQN